MGPPRTRRAISVNPSRFHEGSMNDRTSNAPPVHFLDREQREALERPAGRVRPVSDDWADKQVKKGRLLGQVWDGVRGRLGLKKDADEEKGSRKRDRSRKGDRDEHRRERSRVRDRSRTRDRSRPRERESEDRSKAEKEKEDKAKEEKLKEDAQKGEMPTREEILANYHSLVASGFFTSHAIQSTRQPPPGAPGATQTSTSSARFPLRSATPQPPPPPRAPTPVVRPRSSSSKPQSAPKQRGSHEQPNAATYDELVASGFFSPPTSQYSHGPSPSPAAPAPVVYPTRSSRDYLQPPTPRWASRAGSPNPSRTPSPMPSPASSRGTKRAADTASDEEDDDDHENDPPTPKKRLRKSASRDMAAPKLRNVASRRNLAPHRSVSGPHSSSREYNKLARRVLGRFPGANAKSSVEPDRQARPAARRNALGESKAPLQESYLPRVLRGRRSANEGLKVAPNANRGIPRVPNIPEKFVTCEDRENGAPYLALHL
ncbi:hypothetical protein B0J13DRAFT_529120 [Dactylonectria estremocensis]|uniref:Uncharacterized protein n=1 Tax=Dactylonectria estremocensis TaxID=1079267 RepID=A0A9P9E9S0_9HYPO|nr:hypothetical protein B0J13DRAFT_529120 [Dactylonectria estremocensis]